MEQSVQTHTHTKKKTMIFTISYGKISKIDLLLGHKTNFSKYRHTEMMFLLFLTLNKAKCQQGKLWKAYKPTEIKQQNQMRGESVKKNQEENAKISRTEKNENTRL